MFSRKPDLSWDVVGKQTETAVINFARLRASEPSTAKKLAEISRAIEESGVWEESDEWRISTYFDVRIEKKKEPKERFVVSVSCDGQKFECESPTLERAEFFSAWYRHLIVRQFYSIGPNWAEGPKK